MANTLAYYDMATITAVKSFIVQAPGANVIKLFTAFLFVLGNAFKPSIMFASKAGANPSKEPFRCSTLG